jgi:hypothetical protein
MKLTFALTCMSILTITSSIHAMAAQVSSHPLTYQCGTARVGPSESVAQENLIYLCKDRVSTLSLHGIPDASKLFILSAQDSIKKENLLEIEQQLSIKPHDNHIEQSVCRLKTFVKIYNKEKDACEPFWEIIPQELSYKKALSLFTNLQLHYKDQIAHEHKFLLVYPTGKKLFLEYVKKQADKIKQQKTEIKKLREQQEECNEKEKKLLTEIDLLREIIDMFAKQQLDDHKKNDESHKTYI